jgi:hypothetical protein
LEEENIRQVAERQPFAETHPPFVATTPHLTPEGTLWVERDVSLTAPQSWDVIDGAGRLVAQVALPANRRLLAIGARWLYAAATDSDGLQRVERYRKP